MADDDLIQDLMFNIGRLTKERNETIALNLEKDLIIKNLVGQFSIIGPLFDRVKQISENIDKRIKGLDEDKIILDAIENAHQTLARLEEAELPQNMCAVVVAPGWVKMSGMALTPFNEGDDVYLEPSTGNVANCFPFTKDSNENA